MKHSKNHSKEVTVQPAEPLGETKQAGRKSKILGFSACAVAKALGRAGIKLEEADQILRRQGVEMSRASLSVQLGFGRNEATREKRGEPAPLTEAQIAELRQEIGQ
jgi:hypothetical protein